MVKTTNPVGQAISEALKRQGKSAKWLADQLGISPNAVSKWKKSGKISREQAKEVCRMLGMSLDKLLLGEETVTDALADLPLARSKSILEYLEAQLYMSTDALGPAHISSYSKMIADLKAELEKRKKDDSDKTS